LREGEQISTSEAQWRWARPQPLSAVSILLNGEGVLPVEIAWRSTEKDTWHPLKKEVLYRLEGKRRRFRLTGAGAGGKNHDAECASARIPPSVTGIATATSWCLTRREKGRTCSPGATAPQRQMEPDMLIPADLRKTYDMANLPQADILDDVALGGEAR
jgi:hypothetical protein